MEGVRNVMCTLALVFRLTTFTSVMCLLGELIEMSNVFQCRNDELDMRE